MTESPRAIILHGRLAKEFGGPFRLAVRDPAEAVRALCCQLRGFRAALSEGHYRVIRGRRKGGADVALDELRIGLGRARELHIVPVATGAGGKSGAFGLLLAGAALVAAAFFFAPAAAGLLGGLGASAFSVAGASVTYGNIALVGLGLASLGASSLLARPPQLSGGSASRDRAESFLFGAGPQAGRQGGPVPVLAGRFTVKLTHLISAGLSAERI